MSAFLSRALALLVATCALAACSDSSDTGGPATGDPACAGKVLGYTSLIHLGPYWAMPIKLDGQLSSMIVDTSAFSTVLASSAAKRLGLAVTPEPFDYPVGLGTLLAQSVTTLPSMDVVGLKLDRLTTPVAEMPLPTFAPAPVSGVIGASILSTSDTEIDFTIPRLTLHDDPTCPMFVPPWGGHITRLVSSPNYQGFGEATGKIADEKDRTVSSRRDIKDQERLAKLYATVPRVRLSINDTDITALLDLGGTTVIDPRAAHRAHVTVAGPEVRLDTLTGPVRGTRVRLETLLVGDQLFHDVTVIVAAVPLEHADMVLGGDVLQGERIWFSFKANQVFLQFPSAAQAPR